MTEKEIKDSLERTKICFGVYEELKNGLFGLHEQYDVNASEHMKRFKLLSIIIMCIVGAKSYAYDFSVENNDGVTIYYNYINDGKELEVTYYSNKNENAYSGNVTIPEEVTFMNRTRKVTGIGYDAFYRCDGLNSVFIPETVTYISGSAFRKSNNLESVSIPQSVTDIGEAAFQDCRSLSSVLLPSGVTCIKKSTFSGCTSLSSFTIHDNITSIGEYAFENCSNLKSISFPRSMTSIGESAFRDCDMAIVVSTIENPFEILPWVFSNNTLYNATLYVPEGSIEKYKSTEGWKEFLFIEEGTGPSGITSVVPPKKDITDIYSIDGKRASTLTKGMKIIRFKNGMGKKILMK